MSKKQPSLNTLITSERRAAQRVLTTYPVINNEGREVRVTVPGAEPESTLAADLARAEAGALERVRSECLRQAAGARAEVAVWADKLKLNPFYHLEEADRIFEKAARVQVNEATAQLLAAEGMTVKVALGKVQREVNRGACRSHSTSPSSNLAQECQTRAWVDVLERLQLLAG